MQWLPWWCDLQHLCVLFSTLPLASRPPTCPVPACQEFGKHEEHPKLEGQEEHKPEDQGQGPAKNPSSGQAPKRRRVSGPVAKVDPSKIVDLVTLPPSPLHEVPLQLKNHTGVELVIFGLAGEFVVNKGNKEVNIPVGSTLCGFGRGKFARNTNGQFNPDCHHPFHIKTCDDFVYTSKMLPVKTVIADQRVKDPQAKIAYHSMCEVVSTDKDAFGITSDHEFFFIPAFTSEDDAPQTISQTTVGGKRLAKAFEGSHCVVKTWAVKWGPLGLTPVRPLVLFKLSCTIPAGQARPCLCSEV